MYFYAPLPSDLLTKNRIKGGHIIGCVRVVVCGGYTTRPASQASAASSCRPPRTPVGSTARLILTSRDQLAPKTFLSRRGRAVTQLVSECARLVPLLWLLIDDDEGDDAELR
jgi:hypothetical protein